MKNSHLIIIILYTLPFLSRGQEDLFYRNYTTQQGLSSNIIYDLFEARSGVVYLGTGAGLTAFNGISFKLYPSAGLRSFSVHEIQEDPNGQIWCLNFSNQLLYLEGDSLKVFDKLQALLDGAGTVKSFLLHKGGIYILCDKTLYWSTYDGQAKELLRVNESLLNNAWISLIPGDQEDEILISDLYKIYSLRSQSLLVPQFELSQTEYLIQGAEGALYYAPKTNFSHLNKDQAHLNLPASKANNYLNRLVHLGKDLWLCTNAGLYRWELEKEEFSGPFLHQKRISDIVMDESRGYWVSTVDRGLFHIPHLSSSLWSFSDYAAHRISKGPEGTIIVGTGNGSLYQFGSRGEIKQYWESPFQSEIEFLHFDDVEQRLISSHGIIDFKSRSFKPLRLGKNLFIDQRKNLGLNTYNQTILLSSDLSSVPKLPMELTLRNPPLYSRQKAPYYQLLGKRSMCGLFAPFAQAYFIGAADGLYKVKLAEKSSVENLRYLKEEVFANHLYNRGDDILVSTKGKGLLLLRGDSLYSFFDDSETLDTKLIYKSLDLDSLLLILHHQGISLWNKESKKLKTLSTERNFGRLLIYDMLVDNGQVFLATDRGVVRFPLQEDLKPGQARISSLKLFSKSNQNKLVRPNEKLDNRDLNFKAEVISFAAGDNFQFQYRLWGYDSIWRKQHAQNSNFSYLALPAGTYRFEIRTETAKVLSPSHQVDFNIEARFSETIGFYALLSLATFTLSYFIFLWVLRAQKQKQLIGQGLIESQLSSLRAQMNPHFLFNVLNSVQGLIYSNQRNQASSLLGKLADLMRQVLDLSAQPQITIKDEIKVLKAYVELEAARFEEDFHYDIRSSLSNDELEELIPSMIVQPFVENAIKHGLLHKKGLKKLSIEFKKKSADRLIISVQDNGIGRLEAARINAKRAKHNSFASKAIEERIKLINKARQSHRISLHIQDLSQADGSAGGTMVELILELK